MTDSTQIYNTFHNKGEEPDQYADCQWAYISDSYNGNNTNNTQFLTTPLKTQLVDYHNGYLTIPMFLYSSSGTSYGATIPNIALKQSVLDLIGNITISTDQGQTIVNEQNCHLINGLRLRLEHNTQWDFSEGPEYGAVCDHFPNYVPSATGLAAATGNSSSSIAAGIPITNQLTKYTGTTSTGVAGQVITPADCVYFNKGFYDRVKIIRNTLQQGTGFATNGTPLGYAVGPTGLGAQTGLYYTAIIPLKLLHDFFMQLNFPVYNSNHITHTLHANSPHITVRHTSATAAAPCTVR